MDPNASRETLDHSIMYIFAVALRMNLASRKILTSQDLKKKHNKVVAIN